MHQCWNLKSSIPESSQRLVRVASLFGLLSFSGFIFFSFSGVGGNVGETTKAGGGTKKNIKSALTFPWLHKNITFFVTFEQFFLNQKLTILLMHFVLAYHQCKSILYIKLNCVVDVVRANLITEPRIHQSGLTQT